MREHSHHDAHTHHKPSSEHRSPKRWALTYWIAGIGSLIWLLLRSGTKPKRLTYPCQRVAAANGLGFLAYLGALLSSATLLRRLKTSFSPVRLAAFTAALLLVVFMQGSSVTPAVPLLAQSPDLPGWTSPTAVSNVFAITNVPEPQHSLDGGDIPGGVSADEALHDEGVDALFSLMEAHGDYFYQTAAHPDGLFGSDDVIVIKVNNQWEGRNSTNTDVLKGVIYRLVQHPDGFTGAVIIAENSQNHNDGWYLRGNNSQFQDQSFQEVAQAFSGEGHRVCISDWKGFWTNIVNDWNTGDGNNGYVLEDADDSTEEEDHYRLSYPKFEVNCSGETLRVSMKNGLWNGSSFDDGKLKMINMPVLKRHNSAWATISMKNYLGFITTYDPGMRWISPGYKHCWMMGQMDNTDNCTQYTNEYGLIARQMARIRRADLNIVDAVWVNPRDNASYHDRVLRQDVLLASRDPFAVDYYASEYVLYDLVVDYGETGTPEHALASYHGGWFREGLRNNVARLRAEGVTDTINLDDSMTRQEELNQFNVYVADADDPPPAPSPSLTLQAPNGGESWEIGSQQPIQWTSANLSGDVRLEYSTDGFASSHLIESSTTNDGSYTWTVVEDPSTNALIRVSSTVSATISDTSDAAFSIAYPTGPHTVEDSFKAVSGGALEGGETITYGIVLYEETKATLTLTDTLPYPLTYAGGLSVEPSWKNTAQYTSGQIRWSDTVTWSVPVTITFQAQVPVTDTTLVIVNRAQVSRGSAETVELTASSILNGWNVYLPLVLRRR